MRRFPPQTLLAVLLGDGQLEGIVRLLPRQADVMGVTTITDDDVSDNQVEHQVDRRGAEENRPGEFLQVQALEDEERRAGDGQQREAEPLVEVFLPVDLRVTARDASAQL